MGAQHGRTTRVGLRHDRLRQRCRGLSRRIGQCLNQEAERTAEALQHGPGQQRGEAGEEQVQQHDAPGEPRARG